MPLSIWRTRRTALKVVRSMLLLWLFGVAVGWVNACLLQPGVTLGDQPAAHADSLGPLAAVTAGHGGHDAGAAEQDCQRFCGAGGSAIPKLELAAFDAAGAPPPAVFVLRSPQAEPAVTRGRRPEPHPPPQAPVPIRFLRLTI